VKVLDTDWLCRRKSNYHMLDTDWLCRRTSNYHMLDTDWLCRRTSNYHMSDRRGRGRIVVGFTTTCAISAYHH
jgi:hypothetical protein